MGKRTRTGHRQSFKRVAGDRVVRVDGSAETREVQASFSDGGGIGGSQETVHVPNAETAEGSGRKRIARILNFDIREIRSWGIFSATGKRSGNKILKRLLVPGGITGEKEGSMCDGKRHRGERVSPPITFFLEPADTFDQRELDLFEHDEQDERGEDDDQKGEPGFFHRFVRVSHFFSSGFMKIMRSYRIPSSDTVRPDEEARRMPEIGRMTYPARIVEKMGFDIGSSVGRECHRVS